MARDQTLIIRKVRKRRHIGHHGGAWKVAYADFVTAMMAFFLLLWLLNVATKDQLQGIADYFMPTVGIADGQGVGVKGGKREKEEGQKRDEFSSESIVYGSPFTGTLIKAPEQKEENHEQDVEKITLVETELKQQIEASAELKPYKDNILIDMTPDGLRIQIVDKQGKAMFKEGSAELQDHAKIILEKVVKIIRFVPNYLSITGYTNSIPTGSDAYSNWELSADRANATRRYMMTVGMDPEHVITQTAKADSEPLDAERPQAPVNNRIAIVILKQSKTTSKKNISPEKLLSPAKAAKELHLIAPEQRNQSIVDPMEKKEAERIQGGFDALKGNQLRQ